MSLVLFFPQLLVIKKKKVQMSQVTGHWVSTKIKLNWTLTFQHQFHFGKLAMRSVSHCTCITCLPGTCTDGLMPMWKVEKLKSRGVLSSTKMAPWAGGGSPLPSPCAHLTGEVRDRGWGGASLSHCSQAPSSAVWSAYEYGGHTLNPWMLWFCGFTYMVECLHHTEHPGVGFYVCFTDRSR